MAFSPRVSPLLSPSVQMFSVVPRKFLPNSKSPCWYEEFTGRNTTDPYVTNSYALYSKRFRATFDALRKAFWGHLSHAAGKHFRLRCLPYFYIIGQPKCGTTDLYDRLRLHPEVKFSAIKEPHWWTRKRFGEPDRGARLQWGAAPRVSRCARRHHSRVPSAHVGVIGVGCERRDPTVGPALCWALCGAGRGR